MSITDKLINHLIETNGADYWQYRFNKASNFVTHEEFNKEQAIKTLIRVGQELARIERFKTATDEELLEMENEWHDKYHGLVDEIPVDDQNAIYRKERGIEASQELQRRRR